jgi:L-lysine exporter family protein LysE/ArgO
MASFVWFFSLTYGAGQLSPLFKKPRTWQILDTLMGFVMIGMAINLIT